MPILQDKSTPSACSTLPGLKVYSESNKSQRVSKRFPTCKDIEAGEQWHKDEQEGSNYETKHDIGNFDNCEQKEFAEVSSTLPSFIDKLQKIVNEKDNASFATWYNENGLATKEYTFKELWEEAGIIAYYLQEKWNVQKGGRVVLCYNFGLHFFASFLGCLRAGITAVLVYPPGRPLIKSLGNLNRVLLDCAPSLVLTDSDVMLLRSADQMNVLSKSRDLWPSTIEFKITDKLTKYPSTTNSSIFNLIQRTNTRPKGKILNKISSIQPNDTAFIQYTSGSTGNPKGVMVTFRALEANVNLMRNGFTRIYNKNHASELSDLIGFSWLPQYHDLGLICAIIAPFASGWRMHVMSPMTFIKKPLLWLELMSRLRVSWSVAPDFAFNLVVRKFLEAKKKPKLDLSCIHRLQSAAEPIRHDTYQKFSQAFSGHGLRKEWFQAGYGLAEHVVAVCYLDSCTLSSPGERFHESPIVAVGNRNTFDPAVTIKIVSQNEPIELEDNKVGEVWISSPSVAAGYFGKPKLSEDVFGAKLPGSQMSFLRTGDLGFYDNDHLFVCGRMKDMIIANGVNHYPQDIELAIQDALPAVRPGCLAAFSQDDNGGDGFVEVVFEIRKTSVKDAAKVCRLAQSIVADATGLQVKRIAAIKEKTIPKTTSGKIRRRETRDALHAGKLHLIHDFRCNNEDCLHEVESPIFNHNASPSNRLPPAAISAVLSITCNVGKLEKYFNGMHLDKFPSLVKAWKLANKSTVALHDMCKASLHAIEDHHPTTVQFINLLVSHPEWIVGDGKSLLVEVVHSGFVLEWATRQIIRNVDLFEKKVHFDDEYEASMNLEPVSVSPDAQLFLDGSDVDVLYPILDIFMWMKHKSIRQYVKSDLLMNKCKGYDWLKINILEVAWADNIRGLKDNAFVGEWLSEHTARSIKASPDHIADIVFPEENFHQIYWMCLLAFSLSLESLPCTLSKLLIPCVSAASLEDFCAFRGVSLHLAAHHNVTEIVKTRKSPKPIFSTEAIKQFGQLNKNFLSSKTKNSYVGEVASSIRPKSLDEFNFTADKTKEECYKIFDKLTLEQQKMIKHGSIVSSSESHMYKDGPDSDNDRYKKNNDIGSTSDKFDDECTVHEEGIMDTNDIEANYGENYENDLEHGFRNILKSVMGVHLPANKQDIAWNKVGLTSITSAELRNELSTHFSIDLEIDCFEKYANPALLKQHILTCCKSAFHTHTPDLQKTKEQNISLLYMTILQIFGAIILLSIFTLPIMPALYVGSTLSQNCFTEFTVNGNSAKWLWFPFVIPIWMVGFSILVILSKWIVIGRYKEQEILVQSVSYLQWWFVDRAVHMWEFWVGRFFVDTLLLWLFYRLMGAEISISAELKSTVREFDLVYIGSESCIKYPICCRRFSPWEDDDGPSLRFRKVIVGSNVLCKGLLSPGVNIGDGACVERLSVVDEGGQVPPGIHAVGNPAFNGGNTIESYCKCRWWKFFEGLKLLWLSVELYIFSSAFSLSQIIWNDRLPYNFHYAPLLHWVLSLSSTFILFFSVSIILKWLLIGRRKPGCIRESIFRTFADWAADYHFSISSQPLFPFTHYSRFWNIILKLHGTQIDMHSRLKGPNILPSQMDLFHLQESFTPVFTVDNDPKFYKKTSIVKSSIGFFSNIEAGANVEGKKIAPYSRISGTICATDMQDVEVEERWTEQLCHEIQLNMLYAMWYTVFVVSLVPAYETLTRFQRGGYEVILSLPIALVVQTITWLLVSFILQLMTFWRSATWTKPWNIAFYLIFNTASNFIECYSFVHLFYGCPIYAYILQFLGAKIEGRLLYLGNRVCDYPYIRIKDKTIIDASVINGHFGLIEGVILGPCEVGGVVHGNSFYMSNAVSPSSRVSGPMRAYGFVEK